MAEMADGSKGFTRRNFMKGALVTAAVASMGVVGTACAANGGEKAASGSAESASSATNDYTNIYQGDVNLMPARKAECPGPRGPVAFESREIPASDIQREESFDVVVVGAGVGGLMAGLKAAANLIQKRDPVDLGALLAAGIHCAEALETACPYLRQSLRRGDRLLAGYSRQGRKRFCDQQG